MMAVTKVETQLQFSASNSVTISSNSQADSDAFVPDDACIALGIEVSASYSGTAVDGDYVDLYWKSTTGDVLGDSANDYETDEHAERLGRLDLYASNTPGENPARKFFELCPSIAAGKLSYKCNNAASHNVVLRARLVEKRG